MELLHISVVLGAHFQLIKNECNKVTNPHAAVNRSC